jgi:aarF domain-containing kinase
MKSFLKPTRVLRVSLFGGLAATSNHYVSNDEGAQRSWTFWKEIFPVYLHYRFYQFLNRDLKILSDAEAAVEFDRLHAKYTDRVRDLVYTMRGFYLKQAQLMSTQDDFIPPAYMAWVKDTQDRVPSEFKGNEARKYCAQKLREELNLGFDEVFESFDDVPLGVASIGQVHRAVLKHTKQVVAVKILVPDIEKKFRSDIRTIKSFCELAMPQHVTSFDETEKQFCTGQSCGSNLRNPWCNNVLHYLLIRI